METTYEIGKSMDAINFCNVFLIAQKKEEKKEVA
jgi:hypothetical protein